LKNVGSVTAGYEGTVTRNLPFLFPRDIYLGLLPGYLSTWEEALWWAFALALLLALTGLGVISRRAIRWVRGQR